MIEDKNYSFVQKHWNHPTKICHYFECDLVISEENERETSREFKLTNQVDGAWKVTYIPLNSESSSASMESTLGRLNTLSSVAPMGSMFGMQDPNFFGAPSTFGMPNTNPSSTPAGPPTGGSMFGMPNTNSSSTAPMASTFGMSNITAPSGGSMFGMSSPNFSSAPMGPMFGMPNTNSSPIPGGSMFGMINPNPSSTPRGSAMQNTETPQVPVKLPDRVAAFVLSVMGSKPIEARWQWTCGQQRSAEMTKKFPASATFTRVVKPTDKKPFINGKMIVGIRGILIWDADMVPCCPTSAYIPCNKFGHYL